MINIPTFGFIGYERSERRVKGYVTADSHEEAEQLINIGDVDDIVDSFEGDGPDGYDIVDMWEVDE